MATFSLTSVSCSLVSSCSRRNSDTSTLVPYWIGLSLPFIEIGEAVVIGIFIEDIRILDRQAKLLEPLVRYGWMHHSGLQRCRQVVGTDEMFFRNEKP